MKPFEQFNDIVSACEMQAADLVRSLANSGIFEPVYLYYKPSTETENGALLFVRDSEQPPEGFKLATGEGLRCNVPYKNYWTWIRERSLKLPILAWGDQ